MSLPALSFPQQQTAEGKQKQRGRFRDYRELNVVVRRRITVANINKLDIKRRIIGPCTGQDFACGIVKVIFTNNLNVVCRSRIVTTCKLIDLTAAKNRHRIVANIKPIDLPAGKIQSTIVGNY